MWGRPVDVLLMRDGAMLVSDDYNGIIYRISYRARALRSVLGHAGAAAGHRRRSCRGLRLRPDADAGLQSFRPASTKSRPGRRLGESGRAVAASASLRSSSRRQLRIVSPRQAQGRADIAVRARTLTNTDLNNIAAYFAAQKLAPAWRCRCGKRGGRRCVSPASSTACSVTAQHCWVNSTYRVPAGQQREYLKTQLRGFKAQTRFDMDGQMTSAAQPLSEADIDIARKLSAGIRQTGATPGSTMKLTASLCIPFAYALTALAPDACAQEAKPAPTQEPVLMPEVVTSATRSERDSFDLPVAIDSVDKSVIREDRLQVNISESLNRVPGISILNRQNYAQDLQISSRGFGARSAFGVRGIRLIADGIPATLPDGSAQTATLDLEFLAWSASKSCAACSPASTATPRAV